MIRQRLSLLFAALALATATPAAAQTAPAQPGLAVTDIGTWIASKGGEVQPVQRRDGETWLAVKDGALTWLIFFYGCTGDVCSDIQFAASFSNSNITLALVNDWNRDHRFLKAAFIPGGPGEDAAAVVQYDLLLVPAGVDQLNEPTAVWVDMVADFARVTGYFSPEPAAQ